MINIYKLAFTIVLGIALTSCKKDNDNTDDVNNTEAPEAVALVFPDNNLECTAGTVVNDTQSSILFQWQNAANATSYEVKLTNLNTSTSTTMSTNTNEVSITIDRNTPFEWYVVSISSGTTETAESETWRFYNQGEGVLNYAPFPAMVESPTRGQTITSAGSVNLEWQGNDVDNDLVEFEVLFGNTSNPTTSVATTAQSSTVVSISAGQTYYWRVISKDSAGNTSLSEIFNFKVQ